MTGKIVYGPVEYLAPDTQLSALLEINGLTNPQAASTTHVFLEEVEGDDVAELMKTANHAGHFTLPGDLTDDGSVRIDITDALRKAEAVRPNFHITFLTESDEHIPGEPILQFESVHILHDAPLHTDLDISADVVGGLRADQRRSSSRHK